MTFWPKTTIPAIVFLGATLHAQVVPLTLENTIALPEENKVWDIVPNSEGFFYWVQASEILAGQTTVFLGRTDKAGYSQFNVAGSYPKSIKGYLTADSEFPTIILENYYEANDSLLIRAVSLESGETVANKSLIGGDYGGWPVEPSYHQFRIADVALYPHSSAVTTQISIAVSCHYSWHYHWFGETEDGGSDVFTIFPDFVSYPDSTLWETDVIIPPGEHGGEFVSLLSLDTNYVYASSWHWAASGYIDQYSYANQSRRTTLDDFNDLFPIVSRSCSYDPQYESAPCDVGPVVCSFDPELNASLIAAYWTNSLIGRMSNDTAFWSVPETYTQLLAADVVGNDEREEILGYRNGMNSIHVYRWCDGFAYGHTSEITPDPWRIDIIGRFSNQYRRLALQYGGEISLYSFGEYLASDPRQPQPANPADLIITSFPQPARDQIHFTFSNPLLEDEELVIYNLLGQQVHRAHLTDRSASADINLVSLPAGIYFATLPNNSHAKPQKFLVLK